jgi:hypothetical protein
MLGEYVVLKAGPSLLLTTYPCFTAKQISKPELKNIHPDSPAGQFWQTNANNQFGLEFDDPFNGLGGLGASSAQFLGAYMAQQHFLGKATSLTSMLEAYYNYAWDGQGIKPSGYDVLAQASTTCVYINQSKEKLVNYDWPFEDIDFVLIHTGKKLATHHHLQALTLDNQLDDLHDITEQGVDAFCHRDSALFIDSVNEYRSALYSLKLVANHTIDMTDELLQWPEVMAAKGCGAMGADVILLLTSKTTRLQLCEKLAQKKVHILATPDELYRGHALIENNMHKTLEI